MRGCSATAQAGAEVASAAREAAGDDLVDQLGFAIRACRERLGGGVVLDRAAPGTDGGLSAAVARELAAASARLPQRQREALALRELLRLSHEQVGSVIGIEPAAVAPLLARSRLRLRAELRSAPLDGHDCPERERMLRTATLRQDREPVPSADDDWFIDHLGHCAGCRARPRRDARRVGLLPRLAPARTVPVDGDVSIPRRVLATSAGELELGGEPWLMGIVNATPDSFSDAGRHQTLDDRLALARSLLRDGARLIDVGGESGVTNRPAVAPDEEIDRVCELIERITGELGARVSVDTYKPAVAAAAIAAGASIVNDVSGLRDPELADVCAQSGAGLVLMHTRAAPKQKLLDPSFDGRIAADVAGFLAERIELATDRGVAIEQLMLDPGPDFAKTPAQTVEVLRALRDLHEFGRPLLLAVSRKDFVGAITGRAPRDRLAGTLAAIEYGVEAGAHMLRVHDVAAAADYLAVRAVLNGAAEIESELRLSDELRWAQQRQRDEDPADRATR